MVISKPTPQAPYSDRSSAIETSSAIPAGDMTPAVKVRAIAKSYAGIPAVHPLDLDIGKGEFFCLLGGSGCGKTTLLRMIAGLVTPSSGTLEVDGTDVTALPPYQRPVNMMFQSYALFPHMNIFNNVAFGLRRDGVPSAEVKTRVTAALELVKMSDFALRKPHQLSGGQRQRAALARALVKRPKVLLLDEPLSALDKKLREHTQLELINIQRESGITFVMVTHDQEEAMSMATRIAVMDGGRIVQIGAPSDIYERPASRFVAEFIGSINFLECSVLQSAEGFVTARHEASDTTLQIEATSTSRTVGKVTVAVRPEGLSIVPLESHLNLPNVLEGVVESSVYFGSSSIIIVKLGSGERLRVSTANNTSKTSGQLASGRAVKIGWAVEDGLVLTT